MSRIFKYEPEPNERAIHRHVNEAIFCKIFKDGLTADEANRAVAAENGFVVDAVEDDQKAAPTSTGAKHISDLANIITEASKGKIDRAGALEWLINNRHGRAFCSAYKREQQQETQAMPTFETVIKSQGVVAFSKAVAACGRCDGVTEHDFTAAVTDYAKAQALPGESSAKAFARVFAGDGDDALLLRKAHQIIKNGATMTLTPTYVGATEATAVNDPEDALAQLEALAERLRQSMPVLSKHQAFSKIYCDPANAELVKRERQQNRPAA